MPQLLNYLLTKSPSPYSESPVYRKNSAPLFVQTMIVFASYYACAQLGFLMSIPPGVVTPVWIPSGLAIAAILLLGKRVSGGIILGSFLANFLRLQDDGSFFTPFAVSLAISFGSLAQALLGAFFLGRLSRGYDLFDHVQNILKFICVALCVCIIGSSTGVAALFFSHYIALEQVHVTWWTWWTGDLVGILCATPLLLIWSEPLGKIRGRNSQVISRIPLYFSLLIATTLLIFGPPILNGPFRHFLFPYLLVPFVVWAAFWFGKRGVTVSTLLISGMAIWGTSQGHGPFFKDDLSRSFLMLEPFIAILSITGLLYSAALSERKGASDESKKIQQDLVEFIETAPVGLHWVGPNGIIIWANAEELNMLGYKREEYIGHHYSEFHEGHVLDDMLERLKNHQQMQNHEIEVRCKDGSIKHVMRSCNVLWKNGTFMHTRCFSRDITERKKAENDLMHAHARLEREVLHRTQELFDAYKALEFEMGERMKAQKDILEVSEREQKRIGQDLHDGIAQQLTGLAYMSKTLQNKLQEKSPAESEDMEKILDVLKRAIEDTRRLSRGFYPVELEKLGLFPALNELCMDAEKMFSVRCHSHFDESIDIKDMAVASHLYRVTQEAVSNAMKHGKATEVRVNVEKIDGHIVLSIEDDGIGIQEDNVEPRMGLRIMRYRAKMIGASFDIEKREEGGTRVTFSYPIAS